MLITSMLVLSQEKCKYNEEIDNEISIIQYNDMHKEEIKLIKSKENYIVAIRYMKIICINRNQFISIVQKQ